VFMVAMSCMIENSGFMLSRKAYQLRGRNNETYHGMQQMVARSHHDCNVQFDRCLLAGELTSTFRRRVPCGNSCRRIKCSRRNKLQSLEIQTSIHGEKTLLIVGQTSISRRNKLQVNGESQTHKTSTLTWLETS
jgi:hypothetical protein